LLRKLNHVVVLIIAVVSRCWTWFSVNIVCRNLVWCAKFDPHYRGSTHHCCQRPVTSLEPATQHMAGAALTLPRLPLVDPLPETHCCRSECTAQQSLSQTHFWRSNCTVQARTIAVRRSESCRTYASGSLLRVEGPVKKKRKKRRKRCCVDGIRRKKEKEKETEKLLCQHHKEIKKMKINENKRETRERAARLN
jgi:hypothetical protein